MDSTLVATRLNDQKAFFFFQSFVLQIETIQFFSKNVFDIHRTPILCFVLQDKLINLNLNNKGQWKSATPLVLQIKTIHFFLKNMLIFTSIYCTVFPSLRQTNKFQLK